MKFKLYDLIANPTGGGLLFLNLIPADSVLIFCRRKPRAYVVQQAIYDINRERLQHKIRFVQSLRFHLRAIPILGNKSISEKYEQTDLDFI